MVSLTPGSDPNSASHLAVAAGDPAAPNVTAKLEREVNVISFNGASVLGTSAELKMKILGLGVTVTVEGGDRGWAKLTIVPTAGAKIFLYGSGADGARRFA
jgi:hypothetical protein